jgi:hypothetical protein
VQLGERDAEIVRWASEQKFLMPEQVARWFPEGPSNPDNRSVEHPTKGTLRRRSQAGSWYMRERLRKLVRFGVLQRVPVFTEASSALVAGAEGMAMLRGLGCSHGLAHLPSIDWKNYAHDRAATDVRWVFEKEFGAQWTAERVLRARLGARYVPDAIAELDSRPIAVEVELTPKSTSRYLEILRRYLAWSSPRVDLVLYVLASREGLEHMFQKVLPAALASTHVWRAGPRDLSRFRFTTLSALPGRRVWWTATSPSTPEVGTL